MRLQWLVILLCAFIANICWVVQSQTRWNDTAEKKDYKLLIILPLQVQGLSINMVIEWRLESRIWFLIINGMAKKVKKNRSCTSIENIIYREELKNFSVWIVSVPFSLKGSSKCTNHVYVLKLYAVEYINTVCSLDYSFQFRTF